jgi:hypothetical protein
MSPEERVYSAIERCTGELCALAELDCYCVVGALATVLVAIALAFPERNIVVAFDQMVRDHQRRARGK